MQSLGVFLNFTPLLDSLLFVECFYLNFFILAIIRRFLDAHHTNAMDKKVKINIKGILCLK